MSFFSGIDAGAKSTNVANYSPLSKGTVLNGEKTEINAGDTISGKVMDVSGDKVTVALDGGGTITARLEGNISMNQGQSVVFSTRNAADGQLTLSPLFTNLNNSFMAQNALENAGLPVNARSLSMTGAMMDAGMSISKDNLLSMYRGVLANGDAPIQNLVELKQLQIPLTSEYVEKYAAFKNYENQVTDGISKVADDLSTAFKDLVAQGNEQGAANLMGDVLHMINQNAGEKLSGDSANLNQAAVIAKENTPENLQNNSSITDVTTVLKEGASLEKAEEISEVMQKLTDDTSLGLGIATDNKEILTNGQTPRETPEILAKALQELSEIRKEVPLPLENSVPESQSAPEKAPVPDLQNQTNVKNNTISSLLDNQPIENRQQLKTVMKEAGFSEQTLHAFEEGTLKSQDMLREAETLLGKNGLTKEMKEFFSNSVFGKALSESFKEQLLLRPENVNQSSVEELYQKLQKQTATILDTLNASAPEASALKTDLSNMSGNMDFMNQMNQMFQYVQIPLKMNGSEATGDLYVYTNKKHLAENDGNISALLHLDMNHLGPLDVYASITGRNQVYTRFYVSDEGVMDFLEGHLPELTERLEQRGFSVKAETTVKGENGEKAPEVGKEPSLMDAASPVPVSKLSFDMRA